MAAPLVRCPQARGTVPDLYAGQLEEEGVLGEGERAKVVGRHMDWLGEHFRQVDPSPHRLVSPHLLSPRLTPPHLTSGEIS